MGIVAEWNAFGAFAVEYLGMDPSVIPMIDDNLDGNLKQKTKRICHVVLEAGNFGHNKDYSYRSKYPRLVEKTITFFRRFGEYVQLFAIFPADAPRFFVTYVKRRTKAVMGEG